MSKSFLYCAGVTVGFQFSAQCFMGLYLYLNFIILLFKDHYVVKLLIFNLLGCIKYNIGQRRALYFCKFPGLYQRLIVFA